MKVPLEGMAFVPGMSVTQEDIDREVQAAIEGSDGERDDDESTWHEDPDPTHRGFDWHMLIIGLALAAILAWSAHKQETIRNETRNSIRQGEVTLCNERQKPFPVL